VATLKETDGVQAAHVVPQIDIGFARVRASFDGTYEQNPIRAENSSALVAQNLIVVLFSVLL